MKAWALVDRKTRRIVTDHGDYPLIWCTRQAARDNRAHFKSNNGKDYIVKQAIVITRGER